MPAHGFRGQSARAAIHCVFGSCSMPPFYTPTDSRRRAPATRRIRISIAHPQTISARSTSMGTSSRPRPRPSPLTHTCSHNEACTWSIRSSVGIKMLTSIISGFRSSTVAIAVRCPDAGVLVAVTCAVSRANSVLTQLLTGHLSRCEPVNTICARYSLRTSSTPIAAGCIHPR